jgi:predicted phosphoribosyltransferase
MDIVVAVPAASPGAQDRIGSAADEFVCVMSLPSLPDFRGVSRYYDDFSQVSDGQVCALLACANLLGR